MIKVVGLTKRYGKVERLSDVTFTLEPGCLAILGPNGAGKTTLLRCLAGTLPATGGTVEYPSGPAAHLARGTFGYLPQHFNSFPELTARETLRYFGLAGGLSGHELAAACELALVQVGLDQQAEVRVRRLSGGMVRRLGVAQALLGNPACVLLDEPTVGLDPQERRRFRSLLLDLKAHASVLLSTHLTEDVDQTADTVLVLNGGTVQFLGSAAELRIRGRGSIEEGYLSVVGASDGQPTSGAVEPAGAGWLERA